MSNVPADARDFLTSLHAMTDTPAECVCYLASGKTDRDMLILAAAESPLPTWYPSGRSYRGGSM